MASDIIITALFAVMGVISVGAWDDLRKKDANENL